MNTKPTTKNPKKAKTPTQKETHSRTGQPDWMVDPKKAAVRRARSRNLRGCYSVVMIIAILVVIAGLIYVTLR